MPPHPPVDVLIIQPPQVIREPVIIDSEEPEKSGLPHTLAADQAEHILEFDARMEHSGDGSHQKHLHALIRQVIHRGTQEMVQHIPDPFLPVPDKAVQIIPDRMILVPVSFMINALLHDFVHRKSIVIVRLSAKDTNGVMKPTAFFRFQIPVFSDIIFA